MTDPTHDCLTVCTDPELTVTRASDSDAVHIVGSSEGVTVPAHAVATLRSALKAMEETPAPPEHDPSVEFPGADGGGAGGEDDDARECPECGAAAVVDALGGPRCAECGHVPPEGWGDE